MPKVSVIIPVYNGEKHLEECLDSVLGQTLRDIEILCVDDGSTDASSEILSRYQAEDARIRVFRQQNLYAGTARNRGMREASGEYLMFWDCDDFFDVTALEKMYARAAQTDADICVCGANQYHTRLGKTLPTSVNMDRRKIPASDTFNRKTNEEYILNFTTAAIWNKLIRRRFAEEKKLAFQEIRNGNDIFFTISALCLAERITTVDEPLVTYRKNQENSLVGTQAKAPLTPIQAWIDTRAFLEQRGVLPEQSFFNRMLSGIVYILRSLPQREAFRTAVEFLRREGIEKLRIREYPEEYYYTQWHSEFVRQLLRDSPDELYAYLYHFTYVQLTERTAEKALKSQKLAVQKEKNRVLSEKLTAQREKLERQKEKLAAQKEKLESQKEKLAAQKEAIAAQKRKNQVLSAKLKAIEASPSYRIGRAITWLPRKMRSWIKRRRASA